MLLRILLMMLGAMIIYTAECQFVSDEYYRLDTDFKKVFCSDGRNIVCIGTNGAILHSGNAGNKWVHNYSGTNCNLFDIAAINDEKLIVVGAKSTVLVSSNQGQSWQIQKVETKIDYRAVSFYKNFGVIAGDSGTVRISKDGGLTWNSKNQFTNFHFRSSFFYSENIVLLSDSDGDLFVSFDCGESWSINPPSGFGNYPLNFAKSDNGNIYLLTTHNMLSSSDSGKTWNSSQVQIDQVQLLNFQGNNSKVFSFNATSYLKLYELTDSGQTIFSVNKSIRFDTLRPSFKTQFTNAVSIDSLTFYAVGTKNSIMKSTDGGVSWELVSIFDNLNEQTTGTMFFLNEQTGFIGAAFGKIYKTSDGGATWLPQKIDGLELYNSKTQGIYFKDELNGLAIADELYKLYQTTDGGNTYKRTYISTPSNFTDNIKFLNDSSFLYVGTFTSQSIIVGVISYTSNKCKTQNIFRIDSSFGGSCDIINDSTFVAALIIFDSTRSTDKLLVEHSLFMKSSDKGKTWSSKRINFIDGVSRIRFLDEKVGFISGYQKISNSNYIKKILKTIDGGETWKLLMVDSNRVFGAPLYFNKSDTGYILGRNVLKTTDKGETWVIYKSDTSFTGGLIGIIQAGKSIYITGTGELIYKSINNLSTSVDQENETAKTELLSHIPIIIYKPYPNPANTHINIKYAWGYSFLRPQFSIKVYDLMGVEVDDLTNSPKINNGSNIETLSWDTSKILNGIYIVVFEADLVSESILVNINR